MEKLRRNPLTIRLWVLVWICMLPVGLGAAPPSPQLGVPAHLVSFMANPGQTECPDGWTEAGYALGRLILATADGEKVGQSAGEPTQDAALPSHSHAYTVDGSVPRDILWVAVEGPTALGQAGDVSDQGTTDGHPINLPFMQFLVCENLVTPEVDTTPYDSIAFFNLKACPENWAALEAADGRFLLPVSADQAPGYSSGEAWDPLQPPVHSHGVSATFGPADKRFEVNRLDPQQVARPGTYPLHGETAIGGPVLPFVSLLACQRTSGVGRSQGIPTGTSLFSADEICPQGWGRTTGADGRLLVGMGGNGTQGATFGGDPIQGGPVTVDHTHKFKGEIELKHASYSGHLGKNNSHWEGAVVPGPYAYDGLSSTDASEIPFLVMLSCTRTEQDQLEGSVQ